MKIMNSSITALLLLFSQAGLAALPANQSQALKEQIYSRLNTPSPSTVENMALLNGIVKSVEARIAEAQGMVKSELSRGKGEVAVFQQKVKIPFNPVMNEQFKKTVSVVCLQGCCNEIANRGNKPKGG